MRVVALLSRPFEFEFTLSSAGLADTSVLDDPAFNRVCRIRTPAPERTLAALTSRELREQIARLLGAPSWAARIDQREVRVQVRDAHRGAESVRTAIAAVVAIAYRFDQRP